MLHSAKNDFHILPFHPFEHCRNPVLPQLRVPRRERIIAFFGQNGDMLHDCPADVYTSKIWKVPSEAENIRAVLLIVWYRVIHVVPQVEGIDVGFEGSNVADGRPVYIDTPGFNRDAVLALFQAWEGEGRPRISEPMYLLLNLSTNLWEMKGSQTIAVVDRDYTVCMMMEFDVRTTGCIFPNAVPDLAWKA